MVADKLQNSFSTDKVDREGKKKKRQRMARNVQGEGQNSRWWRPVISPCDLLLADMLC